MIAFYIKLKDNIKDKLSKYKRLDDFIDFIIIVIKIDNWLYKRCLEKKSYRNWMFKLVY